MRVFFLIVTLALIVALGGLEVASTRAVMATGGLPTSAESTTGYRR